MVWPTSLDTKLDEYDAKELPGQQLAAANAYTPMQHLLNLDISAPPPCQRLTGIMATIGKATLNVELIEQMILAGMNIAVINLQFGCRDEHIETIKLLREASKNISTERGRYYPLGIAMRLSGRKIRTGRIAETYGDSVEIKTGDMIRLTTDESYRERCSAYTIYVDFMYFAEQMRKNHLVFIDNESIMLKVEGTFSSTLTCRVERGGVLGSYRDVYVPNVTFEMPDFSERDKLDLEMAVYWQVDIIIASFVSSVKQIEELRVLLGEKGKKMAIVSNIQTLAGYRNFDKILAATNGVMINRQELASDITPDKLVIAQKNMIARANEANIPVTICAHILCSMRYSQLPLRAELLDVANCILDGADNFLLSAETAVGEYPVETIKTLAQTCREAEACLWTKQIYNNMIEKTPHPCDQATGACIAGVLAAQRTIAAAIMVVTTSGNSAQIVAKYRPRCPIIAITRYPPVTRQLHLWRGIIPILYEDSPDTDWQVDIEKRVNFASKWAIEQGFLRIGDPVILITGWRQGSGFTNTLRIVRVAAEGTLS